jgi:hypothetical protein
MLPIADEIFSPAILKLCIEVVFEGCHHLCDERIDGDGGTFSAVLGVGVGVCWDVELFLEQTQTSLHIITEILA